MFRLVIQCVPIKSKNPNSLVLYYTLKRMGEVMKNFESLASITAFFFPIPTSKIKTLKIRNFLFLKSEQFPFQIPTQDS